MIRVNLSVKNPAQRLAVYLYFVSMLLVTQIDNTVTKAIFYASAATCVFAIKGVKWRTEQPIVFLIVGSMLMALLNFFLIGNVTLVLVLLLFLGFYVSQLFMSDCVSHRVFLNVFWIYAVFFVVMILVRGLGQPVFSYVSNNFISVYLLAPLVLYYVKNEQEGGALRMLPAFAGWGISLLASSRSGVIATSLLVGGLLLYKFCFGLDKGRKVLVFGAIFFFVVPVMILLAPLIINNLSEDSIINRFLVMGLESNGRIHIWSDYIKLLKKPLYLLLGGPKSQAYWSATFFREDLHNSYLFVHAYLGLFGLLGLLILMGKSILYAIKKKRWVFVVSLAAFALRAFTDQVFGCNRLTPIIMCFLLYIFLDQRGTHRKQEACLSEGVYNEQS